MKVDFVKSDDSKWIPWIYNRSEATIFHHPLWSGLLSGCYGYVGSILTLIDNGGNVLAGLPLMQVNSPITGQRTIALPFSDHCQPLAIEDKWLKELLLELNVWRKQNAISEFIIHWPISVAEDVYPLETFALHTTCLAPDQELISKSFQSKVRRFVRQAEKANVFIRNANSWEDMQIFYRLHLKTRQRQGTPIQPLRFFRLLWEQVISQGLGFVLLAYKEEQPIAAAVFLHFNRTLTYKYGASDPTFWKLRPNHAIFWHAIQWGCEHGYEIFDWGKTDMDNQGLRDFKLGWGSQEQILHYSVLADRAPVTKLSSGSNQRLMASVIQNSPAWVCRMIGELLYGHFA